MSANNRFQRAAQAPPLNRGLLSEIGKLEELVTAIEEELELGTLVT